MRLASTPVLLTLGALAGLAPLALGACAHGSSIGSSGGAGGSGTGGAITGQSGHTGAGTPSSTANTVTGAGNTTSTNGATTGATGTAGVTTGASSSTGPAMCDPTPSNSCMTPNTLPDVSGDDGGQTSTQGAGSQWVAVHIKETNSGIFPVGLSYTVTLTSPAGMIYDLSIYEGPRGGGQDCNAAPLNGTPAGGSTQSVHDSWSDHLGSDDSKWLNIFVNLQSGTDCAAQWSLLVQGGT